MNIFELAGVALVFAFGAFSGGFAERWWKWTALVKKHPE